MNIYKDTCEKENEDIQIIEISVNDFEAIINALNTYKNIIASYEQQVMKLQELIKTQNEKVNEMCDFIQKNSLNRVKSQKIGIDKDFIATTEISNFIT